MKNIERVFRKISFPDTVEFAALAGHVIELAEPRDYSAEWGAFPYKEEVLPMIPAKFKYNVIDGKTRIYKSIDKLLKTNHYDYLINACDAGREGEAIFYRLYDYLNCKLPVKRYWVSDLTDKSLANAFGHLYDNEDKRFVAIRRAAQCRTCFDWMIGMNFSRALTIRSRSSISVGRVMTPTLAIVVNREKEIVNFKPEDFFELMADFGDYKGLYFNKNTNETRFKTKDDINSLIKTFPSTGTIDSVIRKQVSTNAKTLYSLLELQSDANEIFGYTASQTLDIAQSLYETKKLITYPRTNSRFLPKNMATEIVHHLEVMKFIPEIKDFAEDVLSDAAHIAAVMSTKDYVDDAKITDHHAIIPTASNPNLSLLTPQEKNIYVLIAKRLLAIFMPPFKVDKTTIITKVGDSHFKTNGKIVVDLGYLKLYDVKMKDTVLPSVSEGETRTIKDYHIFSKTTTPPERYTDSTLLKAMLNAGKFTSNQELRHILKETNGLGEESTRGNIIEKMISYNMIRRNKKKFYATPYGMRLIESLSGFEITSPELTAVWEGKLAEIESEKLEFAKVYGNMCDYVKNITQKLLSSGKAIIKETTVGVCPICGNAILDGKSFYRCEKYKDECSFVIGKTVFGTKITPKDLENLLKGKPTSERSLVFKNGKRTKGRLILNKEHHIVPEFVQQSNTVVGTCPICGKNVISKKDFYICEQYPNDCKFIMKKQIKGGEVNEENAKLLLNGKESKPIKFIWSNGKTGYARLKYIGNKLNFTFEK